MNARPAFQCKAASKFKQKIAASKSFVSKSRGWCILRSWKKYCSQMVFLEWKVKNHWLLFRAIQPMIQSIPKYSLRLFAFIQSVFQGAAYLRVFTMCTSIGDTPSYFKSLLFKKGSGLCPLFVFVIHPSYYHFCILWFGNCTTL